MGVPIKLMADLRSSDVQLRLIKRSRTSPERAA